MPFPKSPKKFYLLLIVAIIVLFISGLLYLKLIVTGDSTKMEINSPDADIAKNDGTFKYPCPMESDPGWGEAVFPWHIVDGIRVRGDYWAYGLAFTGGRECYEDTCGWRQATIDFSESRQFNRVVIWHGGDNVDIPVYYIRCWNDRHKDWDTLLCRTDMRERTSAFKAKPLLSIPVEDTFATVVSRKIQYLFNNCNGDHGWIYEFEVYNDAKGDRPECLEVINDDGE